MTDTPISNLLARLRVVDPEGVPGERTRWYRNPDGLEAADEIERLRSSMSFLVGKVLTWERQNPKSNALVEVTDVAWTGEQWRVKTRDVYTGVEAWNELERFMEAIQ